jgi:hypothetical protein
MFSARSAAMDTDRRRLGPAGKNAAVGAFIQYALFKANVTCAAFLAAGGWAASAAGLAAAGRDEPGRGPDRRRLESPGRPCSAPVSSAVRTRSNQP